MEEGLPSDLEREIKALEMCKQEIGKDEEEVNNVKKRPKIQRVPHCFEDMGFEKYFTPKIISFGPFHWGKPYVRVGERYKAMWTAMYLVDTNQQHSYGALFDRINHLKDELLDSFLLRDLTRDEKEYGLFRNHWLESKWRWIMDGCSILQVLDKTYEDLEKELKVSNDQLVRVHQDMLLLENQVPFKLLELICNDDNAKFKRCMHNFLMIHGVMHRKNDPVLEDDDDHHLIIVDEAEKDHPIHLLDYLQSALSMNISRTNKYIKRPLHIRKYMGKYSIGSIRQLINIGIRVNINSDDNVFYPIFYSHSGTLLLPDLTVDDSTMFLNLIGYEMCPDFHNDFEITSYVVFLSSLIETLEDVKELRSRGVFINELATDQDMIDLFNRMDTLRVSETSTYAFVRYRMQLYFESRRSKIKMQGWMREAYSSFLRSPWTVIALLAAMLGLILTFIQTWFAIHPKGS